MVYSSAQNALILWIWDWMLCNAHVCSLWHGILEKRDARPAIYVGSATNATLGVASRFSDYNKLRNLSIRCKDWVEEGFQITYKALLCTSPLPTPTNRSAVRAVFKTIETMVTSALWAYHTAKSPGQLGLPEICPWEYTGLPFDGLCTHAAFIEGVNFCSHAQHNPSASDPDATTIAEVEINALEVSAEERRQAYLKRNRERYHEMKLMYPERWQAMAAKKNANNKKVYWDRRLNRPDEHRELRLKYSLAAETEERKAKRAATYQDNLESKRFYCETCDMPFGSYGHFEHHKLSNDHIAKENGTYVPPKTKDGELKWWCDLCNEGWTDEWSLIQHQRRSYDHEVKLAAREGRPPRPQDERLLCPFCDKDYTDPSALNRHIKKHHPGNAEVINIQTFVCDICPGLSWAKQTERDVHRRKSHLHAVRAADAAGLLPPPTPEFFCGVCGFVYKNATTLQKHRRREQHHEI
ncbi:hypothetical protein B0H65DRAFT_8933 [Neurospora tetraspora]|uniref:C2H2-type domain-containing protein n=1 Tax=Neurospora tetraspora TaxID=94610 RepID=A0AAE0JN61_9PEZI|nr:hypothetical protein B0H65DRAFT_8933 [Neurospora tetraspora]